VHYKKEFENISVDLTETIKADGEETHHSSIDQICVLVSTTVSVLRYKIIAVIESVLVTVKDQQEHREGT
jgi:hypothetical protein